MTNCTCCNGSGWRWVKVYTARYNSNGEVSQPCPCCNAETYARFKSAALEGQKNFDEAEKKARQERG